MEYSGAGRVTSKVGSQSWTPILETAPSFLAGEQSGRCLPPPSLPSSLPSTEGKPGDQSCVDPASSILTALGPSPRVQVGSAGEDNLWGEHGALGRLLAFPE